MEEGMARQLFVVAIDGNNPAAWPPFGEPGPNLSDLAKKFSEAFKNYYSPLTCNIQISVEKLQSLNDAALPRIVGCIIDAQRMRDGRKQDVIEGFTGLLERLKKYKESVKITKLYIMMNVNPQSEIDLYSELLNLRNHVFPRGFSGDDVLIFPLEEEEDIARALLMMRVNLAMNERLKDALDLYDGR